MSGGAGDGPTGGGGEFRLAALDRAVGKLDAKVDAQFEKVEARFEKIDAKFEKIDATLEAIGKTIVRIETKLEHMASATGVAAIKGRVDSLPTTWQMITLVFGILGGAFVILRFGLPHGP